MTLFLCNLIESVFPFQTLSSGPVASASASIVTSVSSSSVLGQQHGQHGYTYTTAGLRLGNSSVPLSSLQGSLPAAMAGSLPAGLQGLASTLASSLSLQVSLLSYCGPSCKAESCILCTMQDSNVSNMLTVFYLPMLFRPFL